MFANLILKHCQDAPRTMEEIIGHIWPMVQMGSEMAVKNRLKGAINVLTEVGMLEVTVHRNRPLGIKIATYQTAIPGKVHLLGGRGHLAALWVSDAGDGRCRLMSTENAAEDIANDIAESLCVADIARHHVEGLDVTVHWVIDLDDVEPAEGWEEAVWNALDSDQE